MSNTQPNKKAKPKKSLLRRLERPFIYTGLAIAGVWTLLATHLGLVLTVLLVERIMLDSIIIDGAKGRLLGPISWKRIQIGRNPDATIIRKGNIDWFFSANKEGLLVHIVNGDISKIEIAAGKPSEPEETEATKSEAPADIELPVTLLIDRFYIGETAIRPHSSVSKADQAAPSKTEIWQSLELAAAWHNYRLDIAKLDIIRSDLQASLKGDLETIAQWPLNLQLQADVDLSKHLPEQRLRQKIDLNIGGTIQDISTVLNLEGAANGALSAKVQAFADEGLSAQANFDLRAKSLEQWQEGLGKAQPKLKGSANFVGGTPDNNGLSTPLLTADALLALGGNTIKILSENHRVKLDAKLASPTEIHPAMQGAGKLIASVNLPTTDKALQYTANVDWRGYPTPDAANADLLLSANGSDTEHNFDVKLSHPRSKIDLAGKAKLGTNLIDIQLKQLAINAEKQKLNLQSPSQVLLTTGEQFSAKVAPLCLLAKDNSGVCLEADHKGSDTAAKGNFKTLSLAFLEPFIGRKEVLEASINGNWQVSIKQNANSANFVKLSNLELRHTEFGRVNTSGQAQLSAPWKIDLNINGEGKSIDQKFNARAKGSLEQAHISLDGSGIVSGDGDIKGNLLSQNIVVVADFQSRSLATFSESLGNSPASLKLDATIETPAKPANATASSASKTALPKINGSGALSVKNNTINFTINPELIVANGELPRIADLVPSLSGAINLNANIPLVDRNKALNADLQWQGFVMPDGEMANFNLDAKGTLDQHSFTLDAERPDATLSFGAQGNWQAEQSRWQGTITETLLALNAGISFALEDQAKVVVQGTNVDLQDFCLRGNPGGLFCADASKQGEQLNTEGKLVEVPIELFSPWLNLPPWLTMKIDGDWRFNPDNGVRAELRTGKIAITPAGLNIEKNTILIEGESLEQLQLKAVSRLDNQDLTIAADIKQTDKGLVVAGTAKAASSKVLNRDDIALAIAPDLQFSFVQGDKFSVKGDVVIAEGKVNLDKLSPSDEPSLSDDIVVVDSQKPEEEEPTLAMDIDVQVNITEPLTITGLGFNGSVEGKLRVHQKPNDVMLATGELNAAGRYKAWGQDLTIDRGKIYYQRSPIAEPLLDINANRQVGAYSVGVNASGLASQPTLTVFSKPSINETDALSMLVTGREPGSTSARASEQELIDQAVSALSVKGGNWLAERYGSRVPVDNVQLEIDESTGKPGVVAGRQISPKLYMGFKVLLESAQQVWEMRYQISERCELTATSGVAAEGGVGCRYETR